MGTDDVTTHGSAAPNMRAQARSESSAMAAPAAQSGRKPRRPRRTRFAGRKTQGGDRLGPAHVNFTAGSSADPADLSAVQATHTSAAPEFDSASTAAPNGSHNSPLLHLSTPDRDQRVDDLELGATKSRLTSIVGGRMSGILGPTTISFRRAGSFLTTSLGKLTLFAVALVIAILAAGLSMAQTTNARQEQLSLMAQQTEPMSHASQNLYSSLTIADASANTAFSRSSLDGYNELRTRYDNAIAQASMSATRAATGVKNVESDEMKNIATIQRLLPVYTGLVESARANSRQGNPVGIAYLATASGMMREQLLPAAQKLYESTSAQTAVDRTKLTAPPWVPLSGILAAIILLLLVQWRLTRANGRLFNIGLFAATICMMIAFIVVGIATLTTWQSERIYGSQTSPVMPLTEARIEAQQLRASETLNLVRRQPADTDAFSSSIAKIGNHLNGVTAASHQNNINAARDALEKWNSGHDQMRELLDSGNYSSAVMLATDSHNMNSSAAAFQRLDNSLQASISDARVELRESLDAARRVSAGLSLFTVAITILAAVLTVLGFRSRLLEYL